MPEMSTGRLMNLVAKHADAHKREKDAKADKETLAGKIIPELKRRGTKALDAMGWKVTHVEQKMTVYSTEDAKASLTKRQFMAVTERVVTHDAVTQALSDGVITPRQLAKFSKRVPKSSYILCNPSDASGDD